ncbi:hypothetical protein TDB9533_03434 [Thalassocella blandensis]|nr:hypothetical protein TDB9533_03434 [Thalassocella blandensis]
MSNALIVLAEGFEELEAVTVMDLLVRAGINLTSASLHAEPVKASRNTMIVAETTLETVIDHAYDAIILPGGLPGADNLANHAPLLKRLQRQVEESKIVAAICAAPRVILAAGIADGKTITCFPKALAHHNDLAERNIQLTGRALEIDLPLITSRGPGTAMDFALCLIEHLAGNEKRNEVEKQLVR